MRFYAILQLRHAGVRFLEVAVALAISEFEHRRPKLTSRERRKIYSQTCLYLLMKASRVVLRGVMLGIVGLIRHEKLLGKRNMLNIPKCKHFTLLVCPLRFLVISAMRWLGNVQSFKTYVFSF